MSMSVNDVISNYTYTYQSEMRPVLDRDYDGAWSKDEINQYAADYKAATGTELDVDAIIKQYDTDSNGSLEFAEYESAADNDAFGLSLLSQKQSETSSTLSGTTDSTGSSSSTQSSSITSTATLDDVLSDYTYRYKGELQTILDKDYDGVWSQEEIAQYAADYKSATGVQLDTEAIFEKYDTDGNNALEYAEYENAIANDAFGTSLLSQKQTEAASQLGSQTQTSQSQLSELLNALGSSENTGKEESVSSMTNMSDWLQSLDNSTRTSLVNTTVWADNTSNMLNMMLSASNFNSYSNFSYGLMQYTNINAYASSVYTASSLFNTSV